MKHLIETLLNAKANQPLFRDGERWIKAGDIRAMATSIALDGESNEIFIHVESAAKLCATLLAAALHKRALVLPAHTQSAYLNEIGCAEAALLRDNDFPENSDTDAPIGAFENAATDIPVYFFTSGSTGAPKKIETTLSRLEIQTRTLHRMFGETFGHVRGTVSHQHIYGLLCCVLWPILAERTADDRAALYWEELENGLGPGVTLISSPAHLTRLPPFFTPHADPPGLVFSSGQALPFSAAQDCIAWLGEAPVEVLGSTETGGIGWRRQTAQDTPWTPLPDVHVYAADDGALEVRSPYLMSKAPQRTGDALDLFSDGRFRLKPREDRIEKIDGKRVSLARVENSLGELPEIASAISLSLPSRKLALGAVVTLTGEGKAALKKLGAFRLSRALRSALSASLEPAERPKHWRFVAAIPTDSQGKFILSRLRALFEDDPLASLDLAITSQDDNSAEIAFTLTPNLIFFSGHFPTRAILPGLAQVHIARLLAERIWNFQPSSADLTRMKFRHVLRPGDTVALALAIDQSKGVLRFRYTLNSGEASQGELGGQRRA